MKALIRKLTEAFGPSGFEDDVRALIRAEVEPFADDIEVDAIGNLIVHKKGDGSGLKVIVAAHMDEIGLMASHITKEGFVRVTNIGYIFPQTLRGSRVHFTGGAVGSLFSEHVEFRDQNKVGTLSDHFVDVGATSREDCPVKIGEAAAFVRDMAQVGNRLIAKSMDDRIGCVVAIEMLKRLEATPHDLYVVFTVQEEVGLRGARAAANRILPDVAIAIDVSPTGDILHTLKMDSRLGGGPLIKILDKGMIAHRGLVEAMKKQAEVAAIPYQPEVLLVGSTDAMVMQVAGPGCAAGAISIPCRYVHTQSEMVDLDDVENCIRLLTAVIANPIDL